MLKEGKACANLQWLGGFQFPVGRAFSRASSSGVSPHQAGGGWVKASEPETEFQETVKKSKAMLKAVALAETFTNLAH